MMDFGEIKPAEDCSARRRGGGAGGGAAVRERLRRAGQDDQHGAAARQRRRRGRRHGQRETAALDPGALPTPPTCRHSPSTPTWSRGSPPRPAAADLLSSPCRLLLLCYDWH